MLKFVDFKLSIFSLWEPPDFILIEPWTNVCRVSLYKHCLELPSNHHIKTYLRNPQILTLEELWIFFCLKEIVVVGKKTNIKRYIKSFPEKFFSREVCGFTPDCLKARAACLVCFISTVNGHRKKRKRSRERPALVVGT
jgi:hypothetical protein